MSDWADLRQLRYFAVLADERHFGRAAERLGIAQPSLSQQVARLEAAVGHPLLVRRPRVALTPAGEELLRTARAMLAEAEQGLEAARRAGRGERGRLVLGFGASVLLTGLSDLVRAYHERYPRVDLRLVETPTAEQAAALRAGAIDLAFARAPEMPDDVVVESYVREPFVAALPAAHPLAAERRVSMHQLRGEALILFPRPSHPGLYDQIVRLCRDAGFQPNVVQESTETLTILALVDAGLGVALVPGSFRRLRIAGVRYRPIEPRTLTGEVALCRRRGDTSPTVAAFLALAREGAQAQGGDE